MDFLLRRKVTIQFRKEGTRRFCTVFSGQRGLHAILLRVWNCDGIESNLGHSKDTVFLTLHDYENYITTESLDGGGQVPGEKKPPEEGRTRNTCSALCAPALLSQCPPLLEISLSHHFLQEVLSDSQTRESCAVFRLSFIAFSQL